MISRLIAIWAALVLMACIVASNVDHRGPPVQGSTQLCTAGALPPETRATWDYWMGPYQFFPCKWAPIQGIA